MQSGAELKTILALAGSKRLLHLEEEIFANNELTSLYLNNLCNGDIKPVPGRDNAYLAYFYAITTIKCRWLEAEHIIAADPESAYWYALTFQYRWPNEKKVFANNSYYWQVYCIRFNLD